MSAELIGYAVMLITGVIGGYLGARSEAREEIRALKSRIEQLSIAKLDAARSTLPVGNMHHEPEPRNR